jgi:hypothetical protein
MHSFRLAKSTVYAVFKETVLDIGATIQLAGIPFDDEVALRKCSIQLINSRNPPSPLHGCVGAVDGLLLHITKPADRYNPAHYFCRKGFYAIPLQVVCDSNYRVIYISMKCADSTHDRVANEVSALHEKLSSGHLQRGIWIAWDEAYWGTESLLTPWPASGRIDESKDV